jgi:hypothetical protein
MKVQFGTTPAPSVLLMKDVPVGKLFQAKHATEIWLKIDSGAVRLTPKTSNAACNYGKHAPVTHRFWTNYDLAKIWDKWEVTLLEPGTVVMLTQE